MQEIDDPSGVPRLALEGELDAFVAPALRERLAALCDLAGGGLAVVDLHRVTFLDSSILGALVGALRRMREQNGSLQLVYPPPPTIRIFELTGLDAVFDRYVDGAEQR